ncbi:helix-turn-helix transcriptional regulator [Rhodococcus sp. BP-349]|uniref:helix-turn-helix domain-containing protein n=1 Tax=unclassified Rhodococcus (in: high G+C Gram-positive bacteria) TaxID=192944 RepID=UPI001C9A9600|nr:MULTISPECIES: XRE family transcriptional regulator [unclassified Rhodococcus (in: high G+C Gram-positive bacteria)]MBY6537914.1 helix-turn-helix transcriptional regulator [Rhodococcus sp. BP-363]MBY6542251.1 helix-turn-helix transcriptional regulator [Rhodococcus sp. BP-369]MBY6561481.1 helix-turn-helix transcriptional regulator [Rhodococcus sp. BP-370]MBY6575773.1 helix-turn-helix transcriptional regulator [Rhodococcus sp. BP-364]MBY6585074.1 helix-turn-helix transcriptional regulator [Rho
MSAHPTDENWIGRRVARLRRERGWTLAVLGSRVGLSTTQLSRIESGGRQSSVGTLIELARAFGLTLSELVAEEPSGRFHVVRTSEHVPRDTVNGAMTTLSGDYPGLAAVLLTIPPTSHAPEARHDGEEWLYLLQGSVEVTVGDEGVPLEPGDALHFSSSTTHTVRSVGDAPARVLLVSTNPHSRDDRRPHPRGGVDT